MTEAPKVYEFCPTCGGLNNHNKINGFETCLKCGEFIPPIPLPKDIKVNWIPVYKVAPGWGICRPISPLQRMMRRHQ